MCWRRYSYLKAYINSSKTTSTLSNVSVDYLQAQATTATIILSGTIALRGALVGFNTSITNGSTVQFKSGCVLDCTGNISSAWWGTKTIIVEDNVTIKPYGGGAPVPIPPGTYTQYKFNRSGEFIPQ